MMSGRSALGVIAGVLLGLGVVGLASSGINPYGMRAASHAPILYTTKGTSTQSMTTTNTFEASVAAPRSNASTFGSELVQNSSTGQEGYLASSAGTGAAAPLSQVNSIAKQPITRTWLVLLPILAALLFGFVLYRVSRVRNEREEPPEAA